jgi:hypothetical protein
MKKSLVLALLVAFAVGFGAKTLHAFATQGGGGGFVAVMVAVVDADNKSSKAESKDTSKLGAEFAALNSSTDGVKLMEQTAGSSKSLKTILN